MSRDIFSLLLSRLPPLFPLLPGCKQRGGVAQRQAAGLGLPGPYRQAVVPGRGGEPGPAGGVPGPPKGRLDCLFLSCGPGAGNVIGGRHHQTVEPAGLQLPEGGATLFVITARPAAKDWIIVHCCFYYSLRHLKVTTRLFWRSSSLAEALSSWPGNADSSLINKMSLKLVFMVYF